MEKGLATFQKDEEQTQVIVPVIPFPVVGNPYPDQTPQRVCERWYQVDTLTVTKSGSAGANYFPVPLLLGQTAIAECLSTFRYIRFSSVSLRFQNSTVPMVYGYGYATSMPQTLNLSVSTALDLSFDDTVLFDYSVQNDITVELPWRTPDQWLDWHRVGVDTSASFQKIHEVYVNLPAVHVLSSTAVPALKFLVMARFNGIETAGHVNTDETYEGQSGKFLNDLFYHGTRVLSNSHMSFTGRGQNPNDEFKDFIQPHYNGTESPAPAKKANSPSSDPSDPEVRNNPFGSLVSSSSLYTAGSGSLLQPIRDFTIRDFINRPTYINSLILTPGFSTTQLCQVGNAYYSRISYMHQFFRMWRGSVRYTVIIFSSPFVSARYNLCVNWGYSTPTATLGDEIVSDVTVRGTTRIDVTLPFLCADQWLPTWPQYVTGFENSNCMPSLYIKEISPAVSVGDIAASPLLLMWESAGDDFEFRSFVNPNPVKPSSFEGQMRVSEFTKQEVSGDGSTCSYPYSSDTEMTFSSIARRWSNRNTDALSPGPVYTEGSITAGSLDQISCLFVYWSGQTKFKLTCSTTSHMNCWHTDSHVRSYAGSADECARPEDGMVNVWTDLTRVLDFTTPFLASTSILPIPRPSASITWFSFRSTDTSTPRSIWSGHLHDENNVLIVPQRAYVAGGDDFSFYFMLPPPVLAVWPQIVTPLMDEKSWKGVTSVKQKGVVCTRDDKSCSLSSDLDP